MKNFLLSILFICSFVGKTHTQCSIDPIPDNIITFPIDIEGTAFQFSTVFGNPLPVNVSWQVDGGAIVVMESETTEQVLIEFPPVDGTYTICGDAYDDSGNLLCAVCYDFDYIAIPSNPCGNVVVTAMEDTSAVVPGWYILESANLDSVDMNTISWDVGGGNIVSINPDVSAITVEYPAEGSYTACMNYTSLNGEACSVCTVVDYLVVVDLPCSTDLQYSLVLEGTYEYYVYAEFSEPIDESTIYWDLGAGVELPGLFQDIPEIVQADFGSPGIYPVCVTANTLDGDICSQCIDLVIDESTQDSCVTNISITQLPQPGLYYSLAINYGNSPIDPATIQWDLDGGNLVDADATLNDENIDVVFPLDTVYNVCVTATNVNGDDCSICVEILASPYQEEPCVINVLVDPMLPESYEYFAHADIQGNVDMSTITWDFGGGVLVENPTDPGENFQMISFPGAGVYTVCASVMGLDGNLCEACTDVVVDEYIQEPCMLDLQVNNQSDSTNYIYDFAVISILGNVDYNEGFTWTYSGGTLIYDGIDVIQLQFPNLGTYNVCVTAIGLDSAECTACADVLVEPYVAPPCQAGFWYYQDTYTGVYYFDSYTDGGQEPYAYQWVIQDLGIVVSDQPSFSLDSLTDNTNFTLCLSVTDANGDVCDYCEWIDDGTFPPIPPSDGCLDWNVIDLETPCTEEYAPVCGCDGITYENACIAEQCFGVIEYTAGVCPGYPDPTDPANPNECTAEFFYFGQPNETGGVDLFFFGFGNNADDYIWDLGNGMTSTGPDAYLTIDDLSVASSLTVCMTTVSFTDTCSVSICETIVLAANPDGWIEGYVFDNSEQFTGGQGQVERVTTSDGDPMSNVLVELVDWYGNIISSRMTDSEGKFSFSQLYFGDYHIHVNIEGATHIPYLVTLDPTQQFAEELNFELTEEGDVVSGLEEVDFATAISLSPNPTNNSVVLSLDMTENASLNISILDITGRTLFQKNEEVLQGIFTKTLELKDFVSGIYFVKIQSGENIVTRKIVRQ